MEQRNPRLRWVIIVGFAVFWMTVILARLGYLQLFRYSEYLVKAQHQQQRIFEISPMRGTIYDRKGRELAVSLPMDSVFADPADISDVPLVASLLSRALDVPSEMLQQKISDAHTPIRLARKLSPETVQRIDDLNLRGIFFQKENRRMYPQHDLASHVLGYVDVDEKGIGGIEYSLDKQIRGKPGKMMVMADGRRRWYDRRESAPDPGASVILTIDETIQYIAQKELAAAIEQTHAKAGTIVVQNPNNGELLAVANWPTFDSNDPGAASDEARIDRAVDSAYEPGSTFKVLTLTAAIENGVVTPDELIDCQLGKIVVAGRLIHDWHAFGTISVQEILEHSSDVGAIKVALKLGSPRFYDVIRQFGIGQLTGIVLPGENHGLLRPLQNWNPSSIGSIAMGQEVSVTPIQIVSAISAVVNGGTLYHPRVVREIRDETTPFDHPESEPRQVTDARTAAEMRAMMEQVVLKGTGKPARLDGYTAGGKSGTAQKIDPATGRYSKTQYNSSFVGFAPVNDPAITVLVVLDSPVGAHHGGEVGGPVFKRVAEQTLAYLGVPHDVPSPSDIETAKNHPDTRTELASQSARKSDESSEERFDELTKNNESTETDGTAQLSNAATVAMPNLSGQSVRAAMEICSRIGLIPSLVGNGVALEQSPQPGTDVPRGSRVVIRFGRPGMFVPTSARGDSN